MEKVSLLLQLFFVATTIVAVWQFYRASNQSKAFLAITLAWMTVQYFLGRTDFFDKEDTIPPRFALLIVPPLVATIVLFIMPKGRRFIDSLQLNSLTLLHTIRIPVEIALYYLFIAKTIPQAMTFEGRNFDILAGITAPFIVYFGLVKNKFSTKFLIVWNVLCLCLLFNIILLAILSAKTPFQQLAFNQPNIAIGHFPFNWLASVIVPLVLLAHLASIKQLLKKRY
jgi:hypothetical protein